MEDCVTGMIICPDNRYRVWGSDWVSFMPADCCELMLIFEEVWTLLNVCCFVAPVNVRGARVTGVITSCIHDKMPTRKTWRTLVSYSSSAAAHNMSLKNIMTILTRDGKWWRIFFLKNIIDQRTRGGGHSTGCKGLLSARRNWSWSKDPGFTKRVQAVCAGEKKTSWCKHL